MPEGSNIKDPEPEVKKPGLFEWTRAALVISLVVVIVAIIAKSEIEKLAENPLGDNHMAPNPNGPGAAPEPGPKAPVTPPPAPVSADKPELVKPGAAPQPEVTPEKVEAKVVETKEVETPKPKPVLTPPMNETAQLNLKELAKHADFQGTIEKEGLKYDVWKSKHYGLTHVLPHRG